MYVKWFLSVYCYQGLLKPAKEMKRYPASDRKNQSRERPKKGTVIFYRVEMKARWDSNLTIIYHYWDNRIDCDNHFNTEEKKGGKPWIIIIHRHFSSYLLSSFSAFGYLYLFVFGVPALLRLAMEKLILFFSYDGKCFLFLHFNFCLNFSLKREKERERERRVKWSSLSIEQSE